MVLVEVVFVITVDGVVESSSAAVEHPNMESFIPVFFFFILV